MLPLLLALACAPAPVAPIPTAEAAAPAPGPATVDALVAALAAAADRAAADPAIADDQRALAARFALPTDDAARRDYARVTVVFEATREGGWWWVDWAITDAEPRSDAVWAAWARPGGEAATAVAECDETAALFAFLVRRLGVADAGLLWPRPDHTVAVWTTRATTGAPVRVIVPTSQVLLGPREGLGTAGFDASRQKRIYPYERADVAGSGALDPVLSGFFVRQLDRWATTPAAVQADLRVLRDRGLRGVDDAALAEAARAVAPGWADRFAAELDDRAAVRRQLAAK